MKISSIDYSYNKKTAFGYNKDYHDSIHKKLQKNKSEIAGIILNLDKMSLETEDKILELEQPKCMKKALYRDLTNALIECKSNIAYLMESFFPNFKYSDNLILQYYNESLNCKDSKAFFWRNRLSQKLTDYSVSDYSSLFQKKPVNKSLQNTSETDDIDSSQTALKAENNTDKKEKIKSKTDKKENAEILSVLTLEKPTPYSPKGFSDVVGMEDIKERLNDELITYIKNPAQAIADYEDYKIRMPRGYLFYGPPGCGKTYITKALAAEAGIPMYKMDISKMGSSYINQTSKNIETAFSQLAELTKKTQQSVILFMDEVDSIAIQRNSDRGSSAENLKTTSTLLKMVENARDNNIIVIAATNKYNLLDDAFKARFDSHIYFPLPDENQIENLIVSSLMSRKKGQELAGDKDIKELVNYLKGYSNRAIVFIIDEAAKLAKKGGRRNITTQDIKNAITKADYEKPDEKEYKKQKKSTLGFIP